MAKIKNKYSQFPSQAVSDSEKRSIELPITKEINEIEISTNIECQGVYRETLRVENNIKIYPNPVEDGNLNINLGFFKETKSVIQIFDIAGKVKSTTPVASASFASRRISFIEIATYAFSSVVTVTVLVPNGTAD